MQELQLYEYAVLRVVPRVEREEFINVGVILFCKKTGLLDCKISLNKEKLLCLDSDINLQRIQENLQAFALIAAGDINSGSAIAALDAASRFRWLTATRSTIIQCSKVHPGMVAETDGLIENLLEKLVL